MQKLVFRNGEGTEIDLTSGNYGIVNWSGLSECSQEIQSQQVPFNDGSVFLDNLLGEREMTFTIAINDDKDLQKRYELKRELISILNPKLKEGYLIYTNDFLSRQIKCIPDLPIFENKNFNDTGTLKAELVFTANNPYWEDIEETYIEIRLQDGEVEIDNSGDVDVNPIIDISNADSKGLSIKNETTNEIISFSKEDHLFGNLEINTKVGEKTVKRFERNIKVNSLNLTFKSICYSENLDLFVAVGSSNNLCEILFSKDGINWDTCNANNFYYYNIGNNFNDVIYADWLKKFILISDHEIYLSSDAIIWECVKHESMNKNFQKIAYRNDDNEIITVAGYDYEDGNNNIFEISSDGQNWQEITLNTYHNGIKDITCSSYTGEFIACCGDGYIYKSYHCTTWEEILVDNNLSLSSITFSSKLQKYILLGKISGSSVIYKSYRGDTWEKFQIGYEVFMTNILYVDKLNILLCWGWENQHSRQHIYKSRNLIDFEEYTVGNFRGMITDICYSSHQNKFVACGTCGVILVSTNIINWKQYITQIPIAENKKIVSICYSENLDLYVACSNSGDIIKSKDCKTWENVINSEESGVPVRQFRKLYYSEEIGIFLAVGFRWIGYSYNGDDWTFTEISYDFYDVVYSEYFHKFFGIAISLNTTLWAMSPDGVHWEYNQGPTQILSSITCKDDSRNPMIIVVGSGNFGRNNYKCTNGETFSRFDITNSPTDGFRKIHYYAEKNIFLLSNLTGIYLNADGTCSNVGSYAEVSSSFLFDVASKGNYCLAVSDTCYMISNNGTEWTIYNKSAGNVGYIINENNMILLGNNIYSVYNEVLEDTSPFGLLLSNLKFTLKKGKNIIKLDYDYGESIAYIRYRNKYVGV